MIGGGGASGGSGLVEVDAGPAAVGAPPQATSRRADTTATQAGPHRDGAERRRPMGADGSSGARRAPVVGAPGAVPEGRRGATVGAAPGERLG